MSNTDNSNQDNPQSPPPDQPLLFGRYEYLMWLLVMIITSLYFFTANPDTASIKTISYSEMLNQVESGQITEVEIRGLELLGRSTGATSGYDVSTTLPEFIDHQVLDIFIANHVAIDIKSNQTPNWLKLLIGVLPWLLIIVFFVVSSRMLRSRMTGSGSPFNFTQSRARRFDKQKSGAGYESVAGLESAKQELQEIIDYLKTPEKFRALGAKMPKGILMMGPPGTGKTLLARATAVEAGVPFYSISGSEFIEMYVGVGASRVRDMFKQARSEAPALIFIDEIDSVGRVRGTGMGGGNDEREQTLNQVLAEMDGFSADEAVVVLAATNRPDVLDPALLRPGRFDRKIVLELPQKQARRDILRVHTRATPLLEDVDLDKVAASTIGFSGADIENLVNEAALHAARKNKQQLDNSDFDYARDRVVMGAERKDLIVASERRRIACHEAGHALAAFYTEHSDPLQRVTIIPHGRALGMTEQMPEEERHNLVEDYLHDRLIILLAGRGAEKQLFKSSSSGAADDLQQATQLARHMVMNWGMSEALGPVGYRSGEAHPFLGMELSEPKEFSEATAELIDTEVRGLLCQAETKMTQLLSSHRDKLQQLIDALLEHESLDREQINQLLGDPLTELKISEPSVA
jgi:cell division protease FtsH